MSDAWAFKEVPKDEFYSVIGPQNVIYEIVNDRWPYKGVFTTPSGEIRGKLEEYFIRGNVGLTDTRYFLVV